MMIESPQVSQLAEGVFAVPNFLSAARCAELIAYAEKQGFEAAKVGSSGKHMKMEHLRNNARRIEDRPVLAQELWPALQPHVPDEYFGCRPNGLNERFRFYRYREGERFGWHADGAYRRPNGEESIYTLLIYLNEGYVGGETSFKEVEVVPQTGLAVFFLHKKEHRGCELVEGVKYVLRSDIMATRPTWKR
ncbi:MAG TPA: oxidoreductase, 2OG-Fe(II) oxygenase [Myxococcales bacterium]|nr:oxidoreductase, 2OG-Fe(II) oxygenase [Deltaproteobacteria bacterium]HAA56175.1 oxidoreductase, 2OG-Fe(II) oxygenase [Myxococcales bacterium]|tara:strand:- start:4430 stop:5002 length:573 start_codon:yes stop_codon:yes gene_type:complete